MPPRDYKGSAYRVGKTPKKSGIDSWDRVLIVVLIIGLALAAKHFILMQQEQAGSTTVDSAQQQTQQQKMATASTAVAEVAKEAMAAGGLSQAELSAEPTDDPNLTPEQRAKLEAEAKLKAEIAANKPVHQDTTPEEPHFDFYTILPSVEVVIPDHELKTRIREEKIGKLNGNVKYIMQAGSFRDSPEAEQLKAKLAVLGIASRIEKARVGEAMWYRVKVGPYPSMTSMMAVKNQLHDHGVDAIVMEFK